jgi:hypothetical protein
MTWLLAVELIAVLDVMVIPQPAHWPKTRLLEKSSKANTKGNQKTLLKLGFFTSLSSRVFTVGRCLETVTQLFVGFDAKG